MTTDGHTAWVTTKIVNIVQSPRRSGTALSGDLVNADTRRQRIVNNHTGDTKGLQTQRNSAELFAGERAPIAAVDEDEYRCVRSVCRENIQRFIECGAVWNIQRAAQLAAGSLGHFHKMLPRCGGVDQRQRGVVLRVDLRLVLKISV